MQMPPRSEMLSSRAATLTPSPKMPMPSEMTSPGIRCVGPAVALYCGLACCAESGPRTKRRRRRCRTQQGYYLLRCSRCARDASRSRDPTPRCGWFSIGRAYRPRRCPSAGCIRHIGPKDGREVPLKARLFHGELHGPRIRILGISACTDQWCGSARPSGCRDIHLEPSAQPPGHGANQVGARDQADEPGAIEYRQSLDSVLHEPAGLCD